MPLRKRRPAMSTQVLHAPLASWPTSDRRRATSARRALSFSITRRRNSPHCASPLFLLRAGWLRRMKLPAVAPNCAASSSCCASHYGDKIDEIAMTFGVQQAIETADEVERTVVVPLELKPIPIKDRRHRISAMATAKKIWASDGRVAPAVSPSHSHKNAPLPIAEVAHLFSVLN